MLTLARLLASDGVRSLFLKMGAGKTDALESGLSLLGSRDEITQAIVSLTNNGLDTYGGKFSAAPQV